MTTTMPPEPNGLKTPFVFTSKPTAMFSRIAAARLPTFIADLLHLAARTDEGDDPIDSTLRLARMHYEAEVQEEAESAD